jgi:hypothetical protein
MRLMPIIANVVVPSHDRDGALREKNAVIAPVMSGAEPSATTVPTATPVDRTALKNAAP